jgi:hypothetical protein
MPQLDIEIMVVATSTWDAGVGPGQPVHVLGPEDDIYIRRQ